MFFKKRSADPITPPREEDVKYKLNKFAGWEPKIYLRILLVLFCLFLLFLITVVPGLKNCGAKIKITSTPSGAAVFVNNKYAGTTPVKFFLDEGEWDISIKKPLHKTETFKLNFSGRIFMSLIFPKTVKKEVVFEELLDKQKYSNFILADFADFSVAGNEYSNKKGIMAKNSKKNYFMSEYLYNYIDEFKNIYNKELLNRTILDATNFCTNPDHANQIIKSWTIINDVKANKIIGDIIKNHSDKFALDNFMKYTFYKRAKYVESEKPDRTSALIAGTKNIFGFNFVQVTAKGGSFLFGKDTELERILKIDDFYILDREITGAQFQLFLDENRYFNKENLEPLITENYVDEFYLEHFSADNRPVVSVSYKIAQEFCKWLEAKPQFKGWSVRLPYETEIEYVATLSKKSGSNFNGKNLTAVNFSSGNAIYDILGNAWELCQDTWCSNLYLSDKNLKNLPNNIKTVKGGSFINKIDEIEISTRGAIFSNWCSPWTTFRIVLEKKIEK